MSESIREVIELDRPVTLAGEARQLEIIIAAEQITDQTSYERMVEAVKRIKGIIAKIVEHHADMKGKAYAAWKSICKAESDLTGPLTQAETEGKRKMTAWTKAQEQARLEQEAALRKVAQDKEDKERLKLAAKLEKKGDEAAAMAVLDAPSTVPVIHVAAAPKVDGVTYKEVWGAYEVLDFAAIPDKFKVLDEKKVRAYGVAMKADAKVNGLRFFSTTQTQVKK